MRRRPFTDVVNEMVILASVLAGLGGLVAAVNFYPSFMRHPLRRLFRSGEPSKFVSGFPLIGSVLLWSGAGIFLSLGGWEYAAIAFIVSLCDTGGAHRLLLTLGYHRLVGWRASGDA